MGTILQLNNRPFAGYDASMFTEFFPQPPTPRDLQNYERSLAPQVMLFWDNAEDMIPLFCRKRHIRKYKGKSTEEGTRFILRIPNDLAINHRAELAPQIQSKQQAARRTGGQIVAILCGNEYDLDWDMRWHAPDGTVPDWGNTLAAPEEPGLIDAQDASSYTLGTATELEFSGCDLVSAAFSMRGYTEDDAPDPGLFSWREDVGPSYYGYGSPITGNGVHYYDTGWWEHDPNLPVYTDTTPSGQHTYTLAQLHDYAEALVGARLATQTNVQRFKHAVRFWSGFHHHLLYWDEVQTKNSKYTPAQHMEAIVGKSKLLIHARNPLGYQLGERVAMLCGFTSNGLGNAYPAEYVMTDPACYEVVRQHMMEEGYTD
jgi:hypothetical protein